MKRLHFVLGFVIVALLLSVFPSEAQTSTAVSPAADEEWVRYVHPEWGVTITYPSDWALSVPDFEKLATPPAEGVPEGYTFNPDLEYMRTLGHAVSLYVPSKDGSPISEVTIVLDTFTISPEIDLPSWVDLRTQLDATENPLADETTVTQVDVADKPFAKIGDQVVYTMLENRVLHIETIWIAKGELVFTIMTNSTDPQVREKFAQVASSLQFDSDKLAAIRAKARFSGDEQQIKASIELLRPQPAPECDIVCRDQKTLEEMQSSQGNQADEESTGEPSPLPTP